jgi:hypothetical protein
MEVPSLSRRPGADDFPVQLTLEMHLLPSFPSGLPVLFPISPNMLLCDRAVWENTR